ncbi:MAG: hypothetical protein QOJ15_873, partial [Bradyrhizobium sp.]|nr:hypothetical protein [Bradyrhizobium sp.]
MWRIVALMLSVVWLFSAGTMR